MQCSVKSLLSPLDQQKHLMACGPSVSLSSSRISLSQIFRIPFSLLAFHVNYCNSLTVFKIVLNVICVLLIPPNFFMVMARV